MVAVIRIAAALILNAAGQTLLVRKAGSQSYMQAGGKIDNDETPMEALQRELMEELNLEIDPSATEYLGRFSAKAANEPDSIVEAELFCLKTEVPITPGAEIAEAVWITPSANLDLPLAPLTRDKVLPLAAGGAAR